MSLTKGRTIPSVTNSPPAVAPCNDSNKNGEIRFKIYEIRDNSFFPIVNF